MSSYSDKSETYCKQEHCDIYFFNLHYEVHIKCIGTEVSNLMVRVDCKFNPNFWTNLSA